MTPGPQNNINAGSKLNYFVNCGGQKCQNVTVSFQITGPMSGWCQNLNGFTCQPPPGNWSLQINAYSPYGYAAGYLQYGMSYSLSSGFMDFFTEYWPAVNGNPSIFFDQPCITAPQAIFNTAGSYISTSMLTNKTGNVVSTAFKVVKFDGTIACSSQFNIQTAAMNRYGATGGQYVPPMMGFTTEIIGAWNYQYAVFTKLQGNFIWTANSAMTWTSSTPGSFSYVQWKAAGTSEQANSGYLVPNQNVPNTITQAVVKTNCLPFAC